MSSPMKGNSNIQSEIDSPSPQISPQVSPQGEKQKHRKTNFQKNQNEIINPSNLLNSNQDAIQRSYQLIWEKINEEQKKIEKSEEDLLQRQERFIQREKEYRRIIDELQREIRMRKGEEENAVEKNQRIMKEIHSKIVKNIDGIPTKINKILNEQHKDLARLYNTKLANIKKTLDYETKKGLISEELKEREEQLNHHLELMKKAAQKISNENQALKERNKELKHKYEVQESDRQLLLRQIVTQKKENGKIAEQIDYYMKNILQYNEEEKANSKMAEQSSILVKTLSPESFKNKNNNYNNKIQSQNKLMSTQKQGRFDTFDKEKKANLYEKIAKYEEYIESLKLQLENIRRKLRISRQIYAKSLNRTELEDELQKIVDNYKLEKQQKAASNLALKQKQPIDDTLQKEDREKIIELLLSQEKVLSLLYEKTYPAAAEKEKEISELNQNTQDAKIDSISEEEKSKI